MKTGSSGQLLFDIGLVLGFILVAGIFVAAEIALISLEDLYEQTQIALPEGPYETAGGFVMHSLGRIPDAHDVIKIDGLTVTVLTVEGKRAGQLLISRTEWKDEHHE